MSTLKRICMILAVPVALSVTLKAQSPRPGMFPWWDSPVAKTLNLTEEQRKQIWKVTHDYRNHLAEVRAAVEKAEADLDAVFNESPVDRAKGNEPIDRLAKARSEMTRTVSQMSLQLRAVLTPEQWHELQRSQNAQQQVVLEPAATGSAPGRGQGRGPGKGPGRGEGKGRRGGPQDVPPPAKPEVAN